MTTEPTAQAMTTDLAALAERAIERLMSISTPLMEGDNLAILLCGHFDDGEEPEDDTAGWGEAAIAGYEEVRAAIEEHFAPLVAALRAKGSHNHDD